MYPLNRKIKSFFRIIATVFSKNTNWNAIVNKNDECTFGNFVRLQPTYHISNSKIDDYTFIAKNSNIFNTKIGRFCSIGANFICGNGIHPLSGISTAPMFYSDIKQNGISLSVKNKIEEFLPVTIENDVFVGDNVTVLSGITIGNGAVIGAGAVVSKDIPPYAVAVGCPIKIIKYRFTEKQIESLLRIQWWNFSGNQLQEIEHYFFDIDSFIQKFDTV